MNAINLSPDLTWHDFHEIIFKMVFLYPWRLNESEPIMIIESDISITELDEAIGYLNDRLKIDQYGNRMDWRKRQTIQDAIDDLLDERLKVTHCK